MVQLGGTGFWSYSAEPPKDPYGYILDHSGVIYNPESLWPFWTAPTDYNQYKSKPTVVRISPDTAFQSWAQEYVLIGDDEGQSKCGVSFHITLEPVGGGHKVAHCHAKIDLKTFEISELICCSSAEIQALAKLQKVITFLKKSQQEAREGKKRPETAQEIRSKRGLN